MTMPTLEERQNALKGLAFRVLDVAEQAGVKCVGVFGTALGAKRHNDMIPWDDDIDFVIFRRDVPRLMAALRSEADLRVWDWHSDPMCSSPLIKVLWRTGADEPMARRVANVDLYVLMEQPAGRLKRFILTAFLLMLQLAITLKLPTDVVRRAARKQYAPVRWAVRLLTLPFPVAAIKNLFERIVAADRKTTGDLWTPTASRFQSVLATYRRSDYEQPLMLPFGKREMPVPRDIEAYLEMTFGDWRKLPPPEERQPHSWTADGVQQVLLPKFDSETEA